MRQGWFAIATAALVCLLRPSGTCSGEPAWSLQYFHDEDESELTITDLVFATAKTGFAGGFLEEDGRVRPVLVMTRDGGKSWTLSRVKEAPRSLYFLDEQQGWMVTESGIWRTIDSGVGWKREAKLRGILRVYFLDANRGYAAGGRKSVYETADGGKTWARLGAADKPDSKPDYTAYGWIEFANAKLGAIVGWSVPPRRVRSQFPDWIDPEAAEQRKQWPTFTILLQTNDGGKSWQHSTTSAFGRVTRLQLTPGGRGVALVEFDDNFEWPSEVFRIELQTNTTERSYREKNRAVRDVALTENRMAYLAAIEPPGKLRQSPVPGKLIMLRSTDLANWTEMSVDYRAFGRRAVLAAAGDGVWVATDTGMILKLGGQ